MRIDKQREGGELREKGFRAADPTFSGIVFAFGAASFQNKYVTNFCKAVRQGHI
jgi:hypothetical protein